MRLTRVKRDDDTLMLQIDFYIFYASNSFQHRSQLAHTIIAIFAFGGDLDRFRDGVIGPFRSEWIGWVRIVWSCRVHLFLLFFNYVPHLRNGCLVCAVILIPLSREKNFTKHGAVSL